MNGAARAAVPEAWPEGKLESYRPSELPSGRSEMMTTFKVKVNKLLKIAPLLVKSPNSLMLFFFRLSPNQ